jgi:hypothetical protein
MKRPKMKKAFVVLTVISLALAASLAYGLMSGRSASAKSAHSPSNITGISGRSGASASAAASSSAMSLAAQIGPNITFPKTPIYALDSDNTIYVLQSGATSFTRLFRVTQVNGNLIGIDFRVADGNNNVLYAVTDTGSIYTINLYDPPFGVATNVALGDVTKVSDLATRFPGGIQSLMDFNPVLNAIRLIGSDRSNYAVVNSGGNLNAMAIQTALSYDPNDVNKGVTPHVSGGAYDGNVVSGNAVAGGVATTRFYAMDYDLDTLVTIQPAAPGGSSATGGGVLQTLGPLVDLNGQRISISPTADIDINSLYLGSILRADTIVGISDQTLFAIDLSQVNPKVPAGNVTNIITATRALTGDPINIIDIAVAPQIYQAENAQFANRAPGPIFEALFPGFRGTGYVRYPSATGDFGSEVNFQVNQTGPVRLIFVYSNVANDVAATECGILAFSNSSSDGPFSYGSVDFYTTSDNSFSAFASTNQDVDLGSAPGFKTVKVRAQGGGGALLIDQMLVIGR